MSTYAHTCNDSPLYKFIKIEVIKEKKIIKQTSIPLQDSLLLTLHL